MKLYAVAFLVAAVFTVSAASAQETPGFENLAEKLSPTVVNISTTTKVDTASQPPMPEMPQLPPGSPFEEFFKEFYDRNKNVAPGDEKVSSLGSGFVIDAQKGYIVTNNHVIRDADEIKVILHDDTSVDAKLIGKDEKTDIAVLKVEATTGLAAAKWGDSDAAKVGSWVLAIGNPFGLGGTVTAGIISARQRNINAGPYDDFIQTDASINRGNSGGPMFNTKGEVIGVNTAIFSPSGGSIGIGFAVPSNLAQRVVEQLIKYGQTKRGWLGVRIQEVTPEMAESLGLDKARGALVSSALADSPADKAGLKSGDVILSIDGQDIDHMRKVPRIVADNEVGKTVRLSVLRNKKTIDVDVTLGQLEKAEEEGKIESPETAAPKARAGREIAEFGLTVKTIAPEDVKNFQLRADARGVVVTGVKAGGAAAEKGIAPGDVVLEIEQAQVSSVDDLTKQIDAAKAAARKSVLIFIERGNDKRFVALPLQKK
jgi:serine protease Do